MGAITGQDMRRHADAHDSSDPGTEVQRFANSPSQCSAFIFSHIRGFENVLEL